MKYKVNKKINSENSNYLEEILLSRGIDRSDIEEYITPSKKSEYSWRMLNNIEQGIKLLDKHLFNDDSIFLIVDCDDDGVTSAAMIYNYIKELCPDKEIKWMMHSGKQHGIELNKIPEETSLLIVPDAGSNQLDEHIELKEKNIDVLILDHHLCSIDVNKSPACIINNQTCNYPNKSLSGAGVVYKFLQGCDEYYNKSLSENYLDLAAQGIIGDMMDLRDLETRYIVYKGLSHIKNPGLKHFLNKQEYSISNINEPTPTDISFYIVPLVNAIIRIGTMEEKEVLFRAFINGNGVEKSTKRGAKPGDTEIIGEKAARIAANVKSRQQRLRDKSLDFVKMKIEKDELNDNKIIFIALDDYEAEQVDSSLTGLIAMQVVTLYGKPTIIVRHTLEDDFKGSARAPSNTELDDFKKFVTDSKMFNFAEGHAQAYGLGIDEKNIQRFIEYSNEKLSNSSFDNFYEVDYVFSNMNCSDIKDLAQVVQDNSGIWGKGVEEPKVAGDKLFFSKEDIKLMGAKQDSVKLEKNGIAFVKFKDSNFAEELMDKNDSFYINLIGRLQMNYFMGNSTPQFIIEDYQFVDRAEF